MRISTATLMDNKLIDVGAAAERYAAVQTRLGTGKQINKPSDDPPGLGRALVLRAAVASIEQFQRNGADAQGFAGASDAALDQAVTLLRQARNYAVQGASDTLDITARAGLADQVREVINQIGASGNTRFGNRYVFSGQQTTTQAFVGSSGSFTYQGGTVATGDADLTVEIAPGQTVRINATGDQLFGGALTALAKLRDNLSTAQSRAISDEDLPALDDAIATLTHARAEFGSKIQGIQQTASRMDQTRINLTSSISEIEDADIPRTVMDLKNAETAYQSALAATARGVQQSLLDFLR